MFVDIQNLFKERGNIMKSFINPKGTDTTGGEQEKKVITVADIVNLMPPTEDIQVWSKADCNHPLFDNAFMERPDGYKAIDHIPEDVLSRVVESIENGSMHEQILMVVDTIPAPIKTENKESDKIEN